MTRSEILRLEKYLRNLFRLDTITIVERPKQTDSVEVQVGGEFVGVLFRDEEDGEVSRRDLQRQVADHVKLAESLRHMAQAEIGQALPPRKAFLLVSSSMPLAAPFCMMIDDAIARLLALSSAPA